MKDAPSEAAVSLKAHARRLHVGLRRPHNWLQLIRYCVVGATGYLVNLGVYAVAYTELPYSAGVHDRVHRCRLEQLRAEPGVDVPRRPRPARTTSTRAS